MPIDPASWYEPDPQDQELYQGDVVSDVPIVLMPPSSEGGWIVLRPSLPHTLQQVLAGQSPRTLKPYPESARTDAWQLGSDLVLAKGFRERVIIVTQSCDLRRNWIQVAPIFSASKIADEGKRASLLENQIGYMFVLPADLNQITEVCFADLSRMTSIHKSYLRRAKLVIRLSTTGRDLFQRHLSHLHGRPFSFSVRDIVPQTGVYLCHRCFFHTETLTREEFARGDTFRSCPNCGDVGVWMLRD
jgi:hypothetical protein